MIRIIMLTFIMFGCAAPQNASQTKDDQQPLQFTSYDVRFTNPECRSYEFDQPVESNSGEQLTAKPKNVFCTHHDAYRSGTRRESPQYKLTEWIRDPSTKEIYFHFLSFSNSAMLRELCDAVEERNVRITFVLDKGTDLAKANRLLECRPTSNRSEDKPVMHLRGHGGGITYAHNKLFMVNPNSENVKIAFTSANFSSGVVLHHENWHFVETSSDTYFAAVHKCMHEGVVDHGFSKREYSEFISRCRRSIRFTQESDIRTFFVPGEGSEATGALTDAIQGADQIKLAAHRFSYGRLISALDQSLDRRGTEIQVIVDDDMYWAGQGDVVGPNNGSEFRKLDGLRRAGAEVRYMETNHNQNLLHHNKFAIFYRNGETSGVFAGAGNFTSSAFNNNYENFYYIEVPEVLAAFDRQYDRMWEEMASSYWELPRRNILP